jgi:ABC-type nitrate/sulfonate/bicarbonate transport system permease component
VSAVRRWLPPLTLLAALVVLWQVLVRALDVADYLLPPPSEVWSAFWRTREVLPGHLWATVSTALVGLALGTAVGVVIAVAIATLRVVRVALYPLVVASQSIPVVVLAPLFVVWFGFGMLPRVLVVALVVFFPVVVATVDGLLAADREQVDLVRSFGGRRSDVLRHVLVPGALGPFFAGMKVAAAYAMFGAVIGEWIGASEGLGVYLERSRRSFRTDQMLVAVVLIALASLALFGAVGLLARRLTPWTAAAREEASR